MKTVVLIGDSIRIGYQEVVRRELEGSAEVWAPEENGRTSRNVLEHLEEWVLSRQPDLVHLNCGLHDVVHNAEGAAVQIALEEYESNLREILERCAEAGIELVWASTTPVNDRRHAARKSFDRFDVDVVRYNRVAAAIAEAGGAPVNDLYAVVMAEGRDELLSDDGVHFTLEGYEVLGRTVAEKVRETLALAG